MQGQVLVPYTGIGGTNMDSGVMPMDLTGSSNPGVIADEEGSTYNLMWTFPGGINNNNYINSWGYALERGVGCSQDDLEKWLKQEKNSYLYNPARAFTDEEISAATSQEMANEINTLMKRYLSTVMRVGQITELRDGYAGCIICGNK